jgi:hypothetical protein
MRNGQNNNNNKNRLRNRNNNHSNNGGNNNNNRRGQNPMTRVFESNGPDIKIRGTASHVAEKYVQLARDARTSGDPVAAENYYQHAEHYFRLIAAAQEQFRLNQPTPRDGEVVNNNNNSNDDNGEDESENFSHFGAEPGFAPMQPQPFVPQPPRENNYQQPRENNFQPRENRPQPSFQPQPQPVAQPVDAGVGGLPSFITGPQPVVGAPFDGNAAPAGERERFPRRRRRPHGPRPDGLAPAPVPAGDDA